MKKPKLSAFILILIIAAISFIIIRSFNGTKQTLYGAVEEFYETSYARYLEACGYDGIMSDYEIKVDLTIYAASGEMDAAVDSGGINTGGRGKIAFEFTAEHSGFYNIELSYIPLPGTYSEIKRTLYIDDEILFDGMKQLLFNRRFTDESKEIPVKNNNEIRPKTIEQYDEQTVYIDDAQKRGSEPYKIYLEKGKHTITFESIKEPMKITGITFKGMSKPDPYSDVINSLSSDIYNKEVLVYQVERMDEMTREIIRSSNSITIKNNISDPNLMPYHPYNIVYNTIGGDNWKYPGETIEWKINVPMEGLYYINIKGRQSVSRGITSYRRIRINGEIPFYEAQHLRFDYNTNMTNYILGENTKDGPYLFYFMEGENTISLEVVLGAFGETYTQIYESLYTLNELYRQIIQITGTVPDKHIDYEITKKIPKLVKTAEAEYERLQSVLHSLLEITGEKGENANLVEKMVIQLEGFIDDPESAALSSELGNFKSNITSLGMWLIRIAEMPLEIDCIQLFGHEGNVGGLEEAKAGYFKKLYYNTIRFFATFFIDNTKLSTDEVVSAEAIKVWIPTGRDQAQVLQNLIDERFIPEYNIDVKLELVPVDIVLYAVLAGTGPDVLISLDQTKMMDFAMRNALVDLSSLEGFKEEAAKYFPSAMDGIKYQEKIFGLPETQMFGMLFYRTDIFNDLSIKAPKTWQELRDIIPVLHMNNYDAYIPQTAPLSSMIAQKGGDLYLGTGKDYGIESALFEEIAMESFKELTDFFTAYKLPEVVDFANRFRTGEVPIGIADYTEYNKFELLAPEIKGLWSFAPIPGILKEDGTIDNVVASTTTQCVILNSAQDKGKLDEAWAFLRWWMSTDVQTEYATAVESILGASARYPTANKEVLVRLPWSSDEADILLSQFENTKGFPPVPGHYMTTRMLEYTFKNVIALGVNPREALYLNAQEINMELTKKRREFGLSTTQ